MSKNRRSRRPPSTPPPVLPRQTYFAPARRAGPSDLSSRIPELALLRKKTVVVVGLGGVGAPSALEFARAGVGEIRLLDFDFVDPGTSVRWPLGLNVAGLPKVEALKSFIDANWPYTKVVAVDHRVGGIRDIGERPEEAVLLDVLSGASLIYDATTEVGVQYLLSDVARQEGVDYICLWTAAGAWGGLVARLFSAADAPCWLCFQHSLDDGTIPSLPFDPRGEVQPLGCADPTFTGSGFDVGSVALMGVRLAVSTLTRGHARAYPDCDWDVAIVIHRTDDDRISPAVETFALQRHPECPRHP